MMTLGELRKAIDQLPESADSAPVMVGDKRSLNNISVSFRDGGMVVRLQTSDKAEPGKR